MSEEYLWDRSGKPDPDIAHMERALRPFGYQRPARPRRWYWAAGLAAAAALALAVLIPRPSETDWTVSLNQQKARPLRLGERIETAPGVRARIESGFVGSLELEPGSRLELAGARQDEQRFELRHGVLHALIWAPPQRFVVDTPSARTIDLGCKYTLRVDRDGAGELNVEMGWVAFQAGKIESFIPAGASCRTEPQRGPGVPYFADAPEALRSALRRYDEGDESVLGEILEIARARDALSLWHLLVRASKNSRGQVYDRLAKLVDLAPAATRAAILAGEAPAFDAAWNSLGLGATEWWRTWKRTW